MASPYISPENEFLLKQYNISWTELRRLKDVWQMMKARCNSLVNPRYADYGGRGISVCPRWENSFEDWLADMGSPPSPDHSIDREDNDGNYEPQNCRWATQSEQCFNRRPQPPRPSQEVHVPLEPATQHNYYKTKSFRAGQKLYWLKKRAGLAK